MILYYRWRTAESGHPCGVCTRLNGSLWHISRLPRPPHPHCRCRLVPVSFDNPSGGSGGGGKIPVYPKMSRPPRYTAIDSSLCSCSDGLNPSIVSHHPLKPLDTLIPYSGTTDAHY